jgi:hypothetical protein
MKYFDLEEEILDTPYLCNDENNLSTCFICNKPFSHVKILKPSNEMEGLKELEIITSHPCCMNLLLKKKKLQDNITKLKCQIDNIDFKLICKTI